MYSEPNKFAFPSRYKWFAPTNMGSRKDWTQLETWLDKNTAFVFHFDEHKRLDDASTIICILIDEEVPPSIFVKVLYRCPTSLPGPILGKIMHCIYSGENITPPRVHDLAVVLMNLPWLTEIKCYYLLSLRPEYANLYPVVKARFPFQREFFALYRSSTTLWRVC